MRYYWCEGMARLRSVESLGNLQNRFHRTSKFMTRTARASLHHKTFLTERETPLAPVLQTIRPSGTPGKMIMERWTFDFRTKRS